MKLWTRPLRRKRKINDAAQENVLTVGLTDKEFDVMKDGSPRPAKSAGKPPRSIQKEKAAAFSTPAKGRHVRAGKENDTPSVASSGSRSAKAQALSKLQDMAPDIALYEKEKKRSAKDGHWALGWKTGRGPD